MYVLIDRERLAFLYAHRFMKVVSNLAWLEVQDSATLITDLDHPSSFECLTDFELKLLFKHTTGEQLNVISRAPLLQIVCDLALRLPPVEVNMSELQAQVDSIAADDDRQYKYVHGSNRPQLLDDELFLPSLAASRNAAEEQTALSGELRPLPVAQPCAAPAAGSNTPARSRSAPNGDNAPRGGVRQVIWDKADAMWAEAGKPTDLKVVLALRKKIMDALEVSGVKRTSSSNELGNWQKFNLKN